MPADREHHRRAAAARARSKPVPCRWDPTVRLFASIDGGPSTLVTTGRQAHADRERADLSGVGLQRRRHLARRSQGKSIDFWLDVDGVATHATRFTYYQSDADARRRWWTPRPCPPRPRCPRRRRRPSRRARAVPSKVDLPVTRQLGDRRVSERNAAPARAWSSSIPRPGPSGTRRMPPSGWSGAVSRFSPIGLGVLENSKMRKLSLAAARWAAAATWTEVPMLTWAAHFVLCTLATVAIRRPSLMPPARQMSGRITSTARRRSRSSNCQRVHSVSPAATAISSAAARCT